EDGIRDLIVTGVQTCALPISAHRGGEGARGRSTSRRRRIMGHKVNPIGLRVGINRTWDSRWFASRAEYGRLLHEDMHIRDHILRSEERRVGKECRCGGWRYQE